jgi:starch synthase
MGLEVRDDVPLFGVVSRFVSQKGFHLVQEALPAAMTQMAMQVAVLGSGDAGTEDFFRMLAYAFPGRAGAQIGFDIELSHLIEAGSDFFLMPSLYEPCGLNQIYSLKYGTLPVVRATGGLEDTVINYNEMTGEGTGFKFVLPTPLALQNTIGWAVSTWYDRPKHIAKLRQQAMAQDFSWSNSAAQYVSLYERALDKKRSTPL